MPHDRQRPAGPGAGSWGSGAKLRVGSVWGTVGVDLRLVKRTLRSRTHQIEACHAQHVHSSDRLRLRVELRFDASAKLLEVELTGLSARPDKFDACVTSVLLHAPWIGLPRAEASVSIELQLRM